ncbi:MAG: glycine cleavage system protein H, partial [Actinobacteria bacterium]|nr:glycine cleavage system protein H [Actinomycetota bacterium]
LGDSPQSINEDPYGSGWICEIELDDANGASGLLDADGYRAITDH